MIKTNLIPFVLFALALPAAADFKPTCHSGGGGKHSDKAAVEPIAPPTADQAEQAQKILNNADATDRQLRRAYRDLMGRAGSRLLRQQARDLRANHQKMTRAQRAAFMRTTLQNWVDQGGQTGVDFDQYVNANNGAIPVIPPTGDLGVVTPVIASPPAQGTVGVIPPVGVVQ